MCCRGTSWNTFQVEVCVALAADTLGVLDIRSEQLGKSTLTLLGLTRADKFGDTLECDPPLHRPEPGRGI